jgi:hypothetical protein
MNSLGVRPSSEMHRVWWGLSAMLVTVAASVMAAPRQSAGMTDVVIASAIGALGTVLTAAALAPLNRYPRWAYRTVASIFAIVALASPALVDTPVEWIEWVRPQIWFLPWFFLTVAGAGKTARSGICAPSAPRAGVMFVASGLIFVGLIFLATAVSRF